MASIAYQGRELPLEARFSVDGKFLQLLNIIKRPTVGYALPTIPLILGSKLLDLALPNFRLTLRMRMLGQYITVSV